jgi:uncharacterized protein YndB with AHSA1/START domain
MHPDTVRLTRTIPAPPDEVYRSWTEPDRLRRWFGPDGFDVAEVELDLRPGGRHRTTVAGPDGLRGRFEGEYRELVPGRRIVTTWSWVAEGPGPEPEVSLLTVALAEGAPGTTELTLVHDRLGPGEDRGEVRQGWEEALGKLAADAGRPPPAKEGLERLEALIGRWTTEGETVPGPSGLSTRIAGTDTYEWLAGGFFVVHRVDVRFGDEHVEAIEIIGYDAANGTYPTHAFDSQGSASSYRMRERDGTWTITGETERSTLVPDGDGATMRASWERSDDGRTWLPWMEIRLTRACEGEG